MSNEKCDGMKECAKDQAIRAAQEAAFREHQWAHKPQPIGALAGASLNSDGTLGYTVGAATGLPPVRLGPESGSHMVAVKHVHGTRTFTREEVFFCAGAAAGAARDGQDVAAAVNRAIAALSGDK